MESEKKKWRINGKKIEKMQNKSGKRIKWKIVRNSKTIGHIINEFLVIFSLFFFVNFSLLVVGTESATTTLALVITSQP